MGGAVRLAMWLGWMLSLLVLLPAGVSATTLDQQRQQFELAMQDLDHGRDAEFLRREQALKGYPLDGYLRYEWLRKHLSATPDAELSAFLRRYADWPISGRLRTAWLKRLAKQQRWSQFLKVYSGKQSVSLQCNKASAELAMAGKKRMSATLRDDISALWLAGIHNRMPATGRLRRCASRAC